MVLEFFEFGMECLRRVEIFNGVIESIVLFYFG